MLVSEQLRVLLFLGLVAAVYVLAAGLVVRLVLHKAGRIQLSFSPGRVWLNRVILGLAGAGLLCMAYGYFIEPYWPAVTRAQIRTSRLKSAVRVVHISDVHSDPKPRLEDELPAIIAGEKPDIIVFTGDSLNSPEGLPVFQKLMTDLAAIAPTYAVRGNWDTAFWQRLTLFESTGVQELNGNAIAINVGESQVWIAGVAVGNEMRLEQALGQMPPEAFRIFLYHYPDLIPEIARQNVDLYCAGHTHGGQVALPFYGALITLSKFGKQYEAGLYRVEQTWLYVNRGVGMEGGIAPRVRFWARPEITVIEIVPEP